MGKNFMIKGNIVFNEKPVCVIIMFTKILVLCKLTNESGVESKLY